VGEGTPYIYIYIYAYIYIPAKAVVLRCVGVWGRALLLFTMGAVCGVWECGGRGGPQKKMLCSVVPCVGGGTTPIDSECTLQCGSACAGGGGQQNYAACGG